MGRYSTSSSKILLQESCSKCLIKCPTCNSSIDKDDANSISNECEADSSDDCGDDDSRNFLSKWDRYLSTLSNHASSGHKQAVFGLRHAIEDIKLSRQQSFSSSHRGHKQQDPVSPRMSRLLEFMSENDIPLLNSYLDPALGRLYEYLDIKAGSIIQDPWIQPPGKNMEQEMAPEVGHRELIAHHRCPICLDDLLVGQQANELQCGHRFHVKCIRRHFMRHSEKWCHVCMYNASKERSIWGDTGNNWRRFWVCFRGPFSRIIARNSPTSSPASK